MPPQEYHGLLVLDKPGGMTLRDAVNRVQRGFLCGTRIGHTGTLDPLATGVLVVCVGVATRLTEYVQAMAKTYRAGIRLGVRSNTDDVDGTVTPVEVERIPDANDVIAALRSFVGEIDQIPPNFSAAKVTGRRAYDLARRGQDVTLQARRITIYGIDIVSFAYPLLNIEVRCGKGTYIRSLARDFGEKLGCGALIESLRRTRVGPFTVEGALTLDADFADARGRLLPLATAVAELPRIVVDERATLDIMQGRLIEIHGPAKPGESQHVAAVTGDGRLVAVGAWDASRQSFAPEKVLVTETAAVK